MKILIFYNEDWVKEYMESRLEGFETVFLQGKPDDHQDFSDEGVEVLSVFSTHTIGPREMDRFPNLKLIASRSTGFDHIDLDAAKERGVVVCNVPTYGENTVAEYAFALLLAVSRRMYESYDRVLKTGNFSAEGLRGFDLRGKKIGVVGTGHIGQHVIKIAKGFEMEVVAYDVREDHDLEKELGFMYVSFDDLLAQADIITLHTPYNEHTHHLINHENISKIKRGAYLINTARGGLVDTGALIHALEEGILAGAGLDVLEEEGYMADDTQLLNDTEPSPEALQTVLRNQYMIDHPRVVIVPHNAFNTQEAIERILDTTLENIHAGAQGAPINVVNR